MGYEIEICPIFDQILSVSPIQAEHKWGPGVCRRSESIAHMTRAG